MESVAKTYKIEFGDEKRTGERIPNNPNKDEIQINNVILVEEFPFYDYNSNSTIDYLKEYFLTTFGQKYKKYNFCKCMLQVYYKKSKNYEILSKDTKKKLSQFKQEKLYVIRTNTLCDCEYKMYMDFMKMEKFDVIAALKDSREKMAELEEDSQKKLEDSQKKYEESQKKLEESQKKLEELQKKFEEIHKENDDLKRNEELKDFKNLQMEKFYDVVIAINSIKDINKEGWEVKFDENGKEKYEKHKDKDLIILGVLGNNNKGKSFLLSKISKIKLLSGTSIHTEGLSVKYPELKGHKQRNLILLDSAGLETPVLRKNNNSVNNINNKGNNNDIDPKEKDKENDKEKEQNKEFKESARDKIMTEIFLQSFIIKVSDILLVVVGKLTYSEQLLINKIKIESQRQNKNTIFIVHNLQEFRTKEQVENYIKNTLLKCSTFNLIKRTWISAKKDEEKNEIKEEKKDEIKEELNNEIKDDNNNPERDIEKILNDENVKEDSQLNDVHFNEIINYENKKKLYIYHLILANEFSEAGKIYNEYAYNFIEHVYNLISEPKPFDIFGQVKDTFLNLSSNFLTDDIKKDSFNEEIIGEKKIKLKHEKDLTLKKCYTDELGFSFFRTGDFEPKYNYFKMPENTLEIRVEIPGNKKCDISHTIIGDETIITIKGEKKKDKDPKNPKDDLKNIREFSDFVLNIPLKVQDFEIKEMKKDYPKWVNGVCCIQYELATKAKNIETEQEDL